MYGMYVCMYEGVLTCMVGTNKCLYVCMYVNMYVCMYVLVTTRISSSVRFLASTDMLRVLFDWQYWQRIGWVGTTEAEGTVVVVDGAVAVVAVVVVVVVVVAVVAVVVVVVGTMRGADDDDAGDPFLEEASSREVKCRDEH